MEPQKALNMIKSAYKLYEENQPKSKKLVELYVASRLVELYRENRFPLNGTIDEFLSALEKAAKDRFPSFSITLDKIVIKKPSSNEALITLSAQMNELLASVDDDTSNDVNWKDAVNALAIEIMDDPDLQDSPKIVQSNSILPKTNRGIESMTVVDALEHLQWAQSQYINAPRNNENSDQIVVMYVYHRFLTISLQKGLCTHADTSMDSMIWNYIIDAIKGAQKAFANMSTNKYQSERITPPSGVRELQEFLNTTWQFTEDNFFQKNIWDVLNNEYQMLNAQQCGSSATCLSQAPKVTDDVTVERLVENLVNLADAVAKKKDRQLFIDITVYHAILYRIQEAYPKFKTMPASSLSIYPEIKKCLAVVELLGINTSSHVNHLKNVPPVDSEPTRKLDKEVLASLNNCFSHLPTHISSDPKNVTTEAIKNIKNRLLARDPIMMLYPAAIYRKKS